jgi:hypothetical protein
MTLKPEKAVPPARLSSSRESHIGRSPMTRSGFAALAVCASFILLIAAATELVTAGKEAPISPHASLPTAPYSATLLVPGRPAWAQDPDYRAQYPEQYAFFKAAFDASNGEDLGAERDSAFSRIVQKVDALQKAGAQISLGGMLSLLIYEGGARLAHYNTLCEENSYVPSKNCWENPKARYSYQFGLGAVHTSNFYPCPGSLDRSWTGRQREKFTQLARQAGFSPTAEQIASVASELHAICPASTQPQTVDYYILRAHDLGIPKDKNGNALSLEGKYPFFTPSVSIGFFFSSLEAQPSRLTSDEQAIAVWGRKAQYSLPAVQEAILASWNKFQASYEGGSHPVAKQLPQTSHLPGIIKVLLDAKYPGWRLADVSEENLGICFDKKSPFQPSLVWGDFDGDGKQDYAIRITQGKDNIAIAFLQQGADFKDYVLLVDHETSGRGLLSLSHKGGKFYDWGKKTSDNYPNDSPTVAYCETSAISYIFRAGKFDEVFVAD